MNLEHLFRTFVKNISADAILESSNKIWEKSRWYNFSAYNEIAEYLLESFHEYGLHTECVDLPADGESAFSDVVLPYAWNCEEATVELTTPTQKVLARRSEQPCCIAMWSPPTDENGLEAEVVVLKADNDPLSLEGMEIKGKWILTNARFQNLRRIASRGEAAGIISGWISAPEAKKEYQWINTNTDIPSGWGTRKNEKPLIGISLPPETVEDLMRMAGDQKIKIKATIKSELTEGPLPIIHSHIPGETGNQEVMLIAPIYGQGAHYHSASTAVVLEIARILQSAFDNKMLKRPKRTIRILLAPKLYGSLAFPHDQNCQEFFQKTLFGLCLESGAGNPDMSWSRWSFHTTPAVQRHFCNGLCWYISKKYLHAWRPQRHLEKRPFTLLSEVYYNDPQIGIPTPWLHGGTDSECKNTSADRPETIDRRSCIDLAAATASILYYAADLGVNDLPQLAHWNYNLSQEFIQEDVEHYLEQATKIENLEKMNEFAGDVKRHFSLRMQCETQSLRSLEIIENNAIHQPEWDCVHELLTALNNMEDTALALIQSRLEARADQLGLNSNEIHPVVKPVKDKRVPKRIVNVLGTITLDSTPYEQWRPPVKKSPRHNLPVILAWWLADGQRTMSEIEEILQFEVKKYREDISKWFDFFEKAGYITFSEEPSPTEKTKITETSQEQSPIPTELVLPAHMTSQASIEQWNKYPKVKILSHSDAKYTPKNRATILTKHSMPEGKNNRKKIKTIHKK